MTTLSYQKTTNTASCLAIISAITWPNVVFSIILTFFHFILEVLHLGLEYFLEALHISFECLESGLDHVVEHICHTEGHDTQIIVFYILMAMAAGIAFYLWKTIPALLKKVVASIKTTWAIQKARIISSWKLQSLINKVKWLAIGNGVLVYFVVSNF
jgi:hypothetical protein